mmetsp:Transcript_92942/g.161518  ORF Transcript_92942/g.161518 Transcript_92942/m.161518 type:complete len:231 (-) Transcript_92942:56-748(-)
MADEIEFDIDDIRRAGFLVKESRILKNWRRRWLVLTPHYLYSFKTAGDYRRPTESIKLGDCLAVKSAENDTGTKNSLCVVTPDRTFFLIADSAHEKDLWLGAIMSCCLPELICSGVRSFLPSFPIDEDADELEKNSKTTSAVRTKEASFEVMQQGFRPCSMLRHCFMGQVQSRHCSLVTVLVPSWRRVVVESAWSRQTTGSTECEEFDGVGLDALPPIQYTSDELHLVEE